MGHIGAGTYAKHLGGLPLAARHMERNSVAGKPEYVPFVQLLYRDLNDLINHLQANPQRRSKASEDSLTEELITGLSCAGYTASHDRSAGGHVDVTVQLGPHSWIGEAKKDSKFSDGYRQLVTRYRPASGDFNHNHGGMLLYCTGKANLVMQRDRWKQKFFDDFSGPYKPLDILDCDMSKFSFYSRHKHPVSGTDYIVRHMMVGLQFFPTDASARTAATKVKSRAAKP